MAYKNLNIPATLVHTVNGKKYTLNGKLLSINESAKTCQMRFGKEIANDVPLKEVYLNEAFLDDLKDLGKKAAKKVKAAWSKIVDIIKSAAGFIVPVDKHGNEIVDYINIPANIACVELPSSICYAPSQATLDICDEYGMKPVNAYDFDTVFDIPEQEDKEAIETYWTRVMKDYGESDRTIKESIQYVNENYYHTNPQYKALNEWVVSMHNLEKDSYGPEIGTKQLCREIVSSIQHQLNPIGNEIPRAPLIWGAPGIGKTAIIKQASKMIRNRYHFNLSLTTVCCGSLQPDDFALPDVIINAAGVKMAEATPKSWLPVFRHNIEQEGKTHAELIAELDDYYNSGRYLMQARSADNRTDSNGKRVIDIADNDTNDQYNGGIIFFDEIARVRDGQTQTILMNLFGDRTYEHAKLASRYVLIAAANRLTDDNKSETDKDFKELYFPALLERFNMYTFVPTKQEWIEWAREVNSQGYQNVDEIIVSFIENAPDGVWYDALDLGSRDNEFRDDADKKFLSNVKQIDAGLDNAAIKDIGSFISSPSKSAANRKKLMWSGRTWDAKINAAIMSTLKNELFFGKPDEYAACFSDTLRQRDVHGGLRTEQYSAKNLDMNKLRQQLDMIPDEDWYDWSDGYYQQIDKSQKLRKNDRLGFFMNVIKKIISNATGSDSLPTKTWDEYTSAGTILNNPRNIKNLWLTGHLTKPQEIEEDNYKFGSAYNYDNILSCRWKSRTDLLDASFNAILKEFPNICTKQQLYKDIKNYESAAKKGNLNDPSLIAKWDKAYTFELENKETGKTEIYNPLFKFNEGEETQNIATILEYSNIARYVANIALYAYKLYIQIPGGGKNAIVALYGISGEGLHNIFQDLFGQDDKYLEFMQKYSECVMYSPAKAICNTAIQSEK